MKRYLLVAGVLMALTVSGWFALVSPAAFARQSVEETSLGVFVSEEMPGVYLLGITDGQDRDVSVKLFDHEGDLVHQESFVVGQALLNILDVTAHSAPGYMLEVECGDYVVTRTL